MNLYNFEVPPLPVAGDDPGPVNKPPDEGDHEQQGGNGHDPFGPPHHQPRLQHLIADLNKIKKVKKIKISTRLNV